ncbi:hypothetical protein AMECASPLE_008827 [Ameca splendens]|uniref:Uncharacterized protein n=1 Tax=Ameca splendens TaxID=208324 RepID=A0ABV0ZJS4_9TELE
MDTCKHSVKQTLLCILKILITYAERFFSPCLGIYKSDTGKMESYDRIGSEPGLWALVIEIPSSTDESSIGGGGWEASLPALKFSKLFLMCYPASASLRLPSL